MSVRALRWAIASLLIVGVLSFIAIGANQPPDPTLRPAEGQVTFNRTPFGDFGEIAFRIEGAPAQAAATRCALLAETAAQQARGLMNRTDLAGYDGMLFRFPSDTTNGFYMKDTPMPLSIAWFDAEGRFVSSADMEPCLDRIDCPTYHATRPYRYALEVPQGGLAEMGIGPGSQLTVGGTCG